MNDAEPLIRPAAEGDLDAVQALLRETWHQVYDPILGPQKVEEVSARWHAREVLAAQLHQAQSSFLVACDQGKVVAHGFAYLREPAILVVSRLYVRPTHQRRGIGARLFAAMRAGHAGAQTVRLFAAAENAAGLAFWRGAGFAVAGEGIEEGARVLHMEKRLG